MGQEIDFLQTHPNPNRDYDKRGREKTTEDIALAKQFGFDFFDGDRKVGYGGFKYDGRWKPVVKRFKEHYQLSENAKILDVGCAKGFMLYDFKELLPHCEIAGLDVSEYAIGHAMPEVKSFLKIGTAESLPYPDHYFDLVISVNSVHNLPPEKCKKALQEIERVGKGNAFITVDAWRNDEEKSNLEKWVLTGETMMHVDDWKQLFSEIGYTGDYHWFIAN